MRAKAAAKQTRGTIIAAGIKVFRACGIAGRRNQTAERGVRRLSAGPGRRRPGARFGQGTGVRDPRGGVREP